MCIISEQARRQPLRVLLKMEWIYTPTLKLNFFCYSVNHNLLYKHKTRLHLSVRINPVVEVILLQRVYVCVTMVQLILHSALSYLWDDEHTKRFHRRFQILIPLEESNTPSCLLLATHVPPDLFSACVVSLPQRTLAENSLTPGPYKSMKAPPANQKPGFCAFTVQRSYLCNMDINMS